MRMALMYSLIKTVWETLFVSVVDILVTSPYDFRGGTIWTMVQAINTGLQGVAYGLAVLFFFMGVIKVSGDFVSMKRPEVTVKIFIRLVLTRAAIMYSGDLMLYIASFVQGLISDIFYGNDFAIADSVTISDEIIDAIESANFLDEILPFLISFIALIVLIAEGIYLLLKVYNRFFKIFIYAAVAPISLAFFGSETTSSTGKSFLRNYFSVCMEGVVILLACLIFSAYMASPAAFSFGDSDTMVLVSWEINLIIDATVFVGLVGISDSIASRIFAS